MEDMLATDSIWSDVKAGDRPTSDALENIFGSTDLHICEKYSRKEAYNLLLLKESK